MRRKSLRLLCRLALVVGIAAQMSACGAASIDPTPTLYLIPTWPASTVPPTSLFGVPTLSASETASPPPVLIADQPTSIASATPTSEIVIAGTAAPTQTAGTPATAAPIASSAPTKTATLPIAATASRTPTGTRPASATNTPITNTPTRTATPTPRPATATQAPASNEYARAVSNITPRAHEIFLDGQAKGNRANIFSKVGDSLTYGWYFLFPVGDGSTNFGAYSYLSGVVDYYRKDAARTGNSFNNIAISAYGGWGSMMLVDPEYAKPTCSDRTPVDCEIDLVRPAVALVMIGTNDASWGYPLELYRDNLKRVIETCISRGVLPVLYTLPHNQMGDVTPHNAIIAQMSADYQIPLVDYRSLMEKAPNRGLSEDGVHPSVPADENTADFRADRLGYGFTIRNLVTLHALDAIWRGVIAPP